MTWTVWVEWGAKVIGALGTGAGVLIAAISYRNQTRIKRAEWIKSLFEKFFEDPTYKDVRGWLDYNELAEKLSAPEKRSNEEKFTDFLNFFEFIGVLYSNKQLTYKQVCDVFNYYLRKIKSDADCQQWIDQYGFSKLKALLALL
ncbi:hypothetical protein Q4E93_29020 [Flavitalea sp. BT771]|uniref:DUF4760 domain-containing protein n=1 Tax=Flavitalea sp. BT771 TaxID=3063329 RepID=UPI0026E28ECC|nr:hypothetical protein [Flavitalea sp. BT771]MDO6434688.1 hypothetical protein [Flavitalea sp. BT771]MDV6223588.1 hypothetical protein [Flavitalea sp. BT771]